MNRPVERSKKTPIHSLATNAMMVWLGDAEDPTIRRAGKKEKHPRKVGIGQKLWRFRGITETENSQSAVYELLLYHTPTDEAQKALAGLRSWDDLPTLDPYRFLTLRKTFTVTKKSYSVGVSLQVINHRDEGVRVSLDQGGPCGVAQTARKAGSPVARPSRCSGWDWSTNFSAR